MIISPLFLQKISDFNPLAYEHSPVMPQIVLRSLFHNMLTLLFPTIFHAVKAQRYGIPRLF